MGHHSIAINRLAGNIVLGRLPYLLIREMLHSV